MCMRMNASRTLNPAFWENSFITSLHRDYGFTTGVFGKLLNNMKSYGCDGADSFAGGIDRAMVMCDAAYYSMPWARGRDDDAPW